MTRGNLHNAGDTTEVSVASAPSESSRAELNTSSSPDIDWPVEKLLEMAARANLSAENWRADRANPERAERFVEEEALLRQAASALTSLKGERDEADLFHKASFERGREFERDRLSVRADELANELLDERAATLSARVKALEEGLRPFAHEFGEGVPRPDDWQVFGNLKLGHFRTASRLLHSAEEGE